MAMMNKLNFLRIPRRSGGRIARCCLGAAALLTLTFAVAAAQIPQGIDDDLLDQAAERSGMDREELLRRAAEAGRDTAIALPQPGRADPLVVLPFDIEAMAEIAEEQDEPEEEILKAGFFGADFFRLEPGDFAPPSFGPVPRDYLLGAGDEIVVDVWGEVEFRVTRIVERDGTIILPRGGKIVCANRTLEQVDRAVRERLAKAYSGIATGEGEPSTFVDVGLGRLRTIRVFVVGDAAQPGAYELSSVATVFTALYAAGGPAEGGTYRDIRLVRGSDTVSSLDIYDYLLAGVRDGDWILREGDTVFVPPRGRTVALEGEVRRPLIFEMAAGETLDDLVRFGGGFTAEAAVQKVQVTRIVAPGERIANQPDRVHADLAPGAGSPLNDGDVVIVGGISARLENWVEINGNVKRPGRYEFSPGMGVDDLIAGAGGMWDDSVREKALLDRVGVDGLLQAIELPLGRVLEGDLPMIELRSRDTLRIFSRNDVRDRFEVSITGAVRRPGTYPWREGMTLHDLVLRAGGLKEGADVRRAEISSLDRSGTVGPAGTDGLPERMVSTVTAELGEDFLIRAGSVLLAPHDRVAVRGLPWWELPRQVTLRGEVYYPGVYTLERPDERLSDVVERAGGLKPTAFPTGARIVREADGIGNVALDMVKALEKPGGSQDIILRDGDDIRIPLEAHTVKVDGAVGFPTSIVWEGGKSIGEYVSHAGGYVEGADKGRTRVVYPNGESRSVRKIWRDPSVMAGSTIVVPWKSPRESEGNLSAIKEIAAIMASLATVYLVIDRTN